MANLEKPANRITAGAAGGSVDAFLHALQHPLKIEIGIVRGLILATDPRIGEGIKWNAPSFHAGEYFATFHLRNRSAVQLVLHLGAKVRPGRAALQIEDPGKLLEWLAADRATLRLRDRAAIARHGEALMKIVRQWIDQLG